MANSWTNRGAHEIFSNATALLTDTIKFGLGVGATYVFSRAHNFVNDGGTQAANPGHASNELAVTGYTAGFAGTGRKTLAGKALTEDDGQNYSKFTASNLTWTALGAGGPVTFGWLYRHITSDAASPYLAFFDSGFPFTPNGGDINLNWDTTHGVATLA